MESKISPYTNVHVNEKVFILLLCIMFIDYNVYGYFIFYIPLAYAMFKYKIFRYADSTFMLLAFFGLFYSGFDVLNTGEYNYTSNIQPIINFPLLYLIGKIIQERNDRLSIIFILLLFALASASLTIISIYDNVVREGFSIVSRDIHLIGYGNAEQLTSATSLYSKILPLSLFLVFLFLDCNKKLKILAISLSLLSIYCCLRLQSRSSIYILGIAVLVTMLSGENRNASNKIIGALLLVGGIMFVLNHYSDELSILNRFQDNGVFDNNNSDSRSDLAKAVITDVPSHPFGGLRKERYAHNLWLDVSRFSGWLPLLFLILVTKRWLMTTLAIYRNKELESSYRSFIVVVSATLFAYFNTEPIIEGAPMLFSFFCVYLGIITETKNKMQ